jgi:hypothetical protein
VAMDYQVVSADVLQKNINENSEVSMAERIHRIVCKFIMNMIPENFLSQFLLDVTFRY